MFRLVRRPIPLARSFYSQHNSFRNLPLSTKLKYGAVTIAGIGCLCVLTSVGVFIVAIGGLAYGGYSLFNSFQSKTGFTNPSNLLNRYIPKTPMNSVMKGSVPFLMLQSLIRIIGLPLQQVLKHSNEMQQIIEQKLKTNQQVKSLLGNSFELDDAENFSETTVNGIGRISAVYPVISPLGHAKIYIEVDIISSSKHLKKMEFHDTRRNKRIDLLKTTIIDAEYTDI